MRILVGVDGSSAAGVACDFVAGRTWPVGTRVHLLGAIEPIVDWTGLAPVQNDTIASDREALGIVLEERANALRRCGLTVTTSVELGPPAHLLIGRASRSFTDLIVVGSRKLGPVASAVLGSVSAHLVDHAPCPVLVARSSSASRMLLATDGTPSSRTIPTVLATWGTAFRGLPVEVLSVAPRDVLVTPWADGDPADADLVVHEGIAEQVADEMLELGWPAAALALRGDPGRTIVRAGQEWGADLIVTGSRGIGKLRRLVLGSVAHDVLMHAQSSVLVVRGQVVAPIREAAPVLSGLAMI